MKYDLNLLQTAAQQFMNKGEHHSAIKIYLFMSDGDPSLDGGFLGEQLGRCYEAIGDLMAAKYWYGRAIEENPEVRKLSKQKRKALENVNVQDIVPGFMLKAENEPS
jgi:hypothetical protein